MSCSSHLEADGCVFPSGTFYIPSSLKCWCTDLLDPAKQSYGLYDAWMHFPLHTSARQVQHNTVKDLTTMQRVFPVSSANIPSLPYRMWPGSRDEGPFLLVLDTVDKEEHLKRGRKDHYFHFKRLLKYRRCVKGQGLGREGAGWAGTEQSLLWEQGTCLQQEANLQTLSMTFSEIQKHWVSCELMHIVGILPWVCILFVFLCRFF